MRRYTVTFKAKDSKDRIWHRIREGAGADNVVEFKPSKKTYKDVPEHLAVIAAETGHFTIKEQE